ncbi:aldo/keto reductase [Flavobacteriaceae bacterium]|nr:aldo/keto reductase [Flavobacteriaceae bacterium]MDC3354490.1 aldo/keto reductase [Flavobacteriaceae bacterium]
MEYNLLSGTQIKVSKICLGTMTWGRQNTEQQGHDQMDFAFEQGVNFFDTAELYPIPPRQEEQGDTERYIGTWFKKSGLRNKIILASKIAGPAVFTQHIRTDKSYSKRTIDAAIENNLKRLQTDYIDLYQLHWPERPTNYFGKRGYDYKRGDQWEENFEEVLDALNDHVKKGNIRYIGLSNETPWGTMGFLRASNANRPRVRTIQNPYSLLNRTFEVGNAEVCHREEVGLLAYSPLAFGVLSGKYRSGQKPENARLTLFPHYDRYSSDPCNRAVDLYHELAIKNGLSLTQLALAFVNDRPFMTSNIIGATDLSQLKENIDTANIRLSDEVLEEINSIHESIPNPST